MAAQNYYKRMTALQNIRNLNCLISYHIFNFVYGAEAE